MMSKKAIRTKFLKEGIKPTNQQTIGVTVKRLLLMI